MTSVVFCMVFLSSTIFAAEPSKEMLDKVEKLKAKDIQLIDYHIHLRNGMTFEKAYDWQQKSGIRSGVLKNHGRGWPLSNNEQLAAFIKEAKGYDLLVGIQVNDRDWHKAIDKKLLAELDYVLGDSLVLPGPDGKSHKLWIAEETQTDNPKAWFEHYFKHCMTVANEPINIMALATYLPKNMEQYYDEFWTLERQTELIDAIVKNNIAIEIQPTEKYPKQDFIDLARKKGARLTIGRNNHDDKVNELIPSLNALEKMDVKPDEIYVLPKKNSKQL